MTLQELSFEPEMEKKRMIHLFAFVSPIASNYRAADSVFEKDRYDPKRTRVKK